MTDKIDQALAVAVAQFSAKRPQSAALFERAKRVMPGGNTRTVLFAQPFPIRIARAEGACLHDVDGHSYRDFLGEYSAGIYGHSHPAIAAAVAEAVAGGLNFGAHHVREVEFAESVCQRFALERVRFTNSGTEANMMAIAAARAFTGRGRIMVMQGGYHGGTLYFVRGASPVNAPFEAVLAPFNDIEATRALISDDLAAIVVEPMQGSGGCIPATVEFLAMLRAEATRRGIVLIFDEVMTSRFGSGGLAQVHGIQPDLKTLGKYIGGGMSFGAFGGKATVMDLFDPTRPNALPHAGTFNNNTLTMAAGLKGIRDIFTPDAAAALNARGERLKTALNGVFMHYQMAWQVTGIGSLLNFHPVSGAIASTGDLAKADVRLRRLLYYHLLEEGIYLAERGYMALSLALAEADHEALLQAVEGFAQRYRGVV
ncbi:MAG: aminotransferase class III-fold pyridoxal phosphate-dependent enzyme [Alphaproteobacteria bacterium]|nr:aminotransferase class III-fold pyridoxal phosphate-dependent enzyme [Alphaproteobacteria bacterium]